MEHQKIADMWADLQKASQVPKGGVLSSCEPELQELMRQIDQMVQARKSEWERDRQTLLAKLEVREQEYKIQRTTLQQKHTEVGQLRAQIEILEKNQREAGAQYEHELMSVRSEVDHMKREYERLHKRYNQRKAVKQSTASTSSAGSQTNSSDIKRLTAKIEEYKRRSSEWEQEKRTLQRQMEALESQRKISDDKCGLVQQQSRDYQCQLEKHREILDTTELNLKSQISQLEGQLQRARDMVNSQDTQLSRLRGSLDEAVQSHRRALDEKTQVEGELRRAQQVVRRLEEEAHESQLSMSAKDEVCRVTQMDLNRTRSQLQQAEEQLATKDKQIEQIEKESKEVQAEHSSRLQKELARTKDQVRSLKKSEQKLQGEVSELREQLDVIRGECAHLNAQLALKIRELRNVEKNDMKNLREECRKLENELSVAQERHLGESDGMKREFSKLTAELHQRNLALATLSERVTDMEKQVRDRDEGLERKVAELQVCNAQLEALRLENRHLRRSALNMSAVNRSLNLNDTVDVTEAQGHIQELQTAYDVSLGALEKQNEKLSDDLALLKQQLRATEENTQRRIQSALRESQTTVAAVRESEERRVEEIRREGSRQVEESRRHQESLVRQYEAELSDLKSQMSQLEDELDSRNNTLTRLGLEHNALSEFVSGVDHIVTSPARHNHHNESSQLQYHLTTSLSTDGSGPEGEDDDLLVDSVEAATQRFLAEQEARTQELEDRLNMHIEDLKLATHGAHSDQTPLR